MNRILHTLATRLRILLRVVTTLRLREVLTDEFHRLYYGTSESTWSNTFFMGVPAAKCPLDLWVYHELIYDLKPDLIIECGTFKGGSALFLAAMCDLAGHGRVVSIDVEEALPRPSHPRLRYLTASSIAPETVEAVKTLSADSERVVVILDSNHRCDHVLEELRAYSRLVPVGGYLIVEDTNLNGHPVTPKFGPGPMEAVRRFLQETDDFVIDKTREKFFLTFNPNGYLKRVNP